MTAETTAATATADPSAGTDQTQAANHTATDAAKPEGSQVTPPADDAAKAEPQSTEGETPPEAAEPTQYEFKVPEGMTMDADFAKAITPVLQKHKLTQEAVDDLVGAYAERIKQIESGAGEAFEQAYADRRKADIEAQTEKWLSATLAAKDLGESVRNRAVAAIGEIGTPEIKAAFEEQGWGNHPELVRLIDRLIDYVPPEKGERAAGGGGAGGDQLSRLYPNESTN